MLLDDDLAAIESYVVGKSRLHNRFLHGDGVVCGLDVTCHPCGGGHVLVGSGYALDCCGNDIVVPCREELDILAMIRQLRTATNGGYDCGPCVPTGEPAKDTGQGEPSPDTQIGGQDAQPADFRPRQDPSESDPKIPQPRRYWLYVRYAEQLSDPVEPYATDAVCSPAGCEASRVREGYQFFLRSHRCEPEDADIIDRVLACVGPHKDLLRALDISVWITTWLKSIVIFLQSLSVSGTAVTESTAQLRQPPMTRVKSYATDASDAPVPKDATSSSQLINDVAAAAATVLRAKALNEADRNAAGLTDAEISDASAALRTAAQKLRAGKVLDHLDATARPFAEASLRMSVRAADHQAGQPLVGNLSMLAKGVVADYQGFHDMVQMLREYKAWLLKMAERAAATDCSLSEEVAAVWIPVIAQVGEEIGESASEDLDVANQLNAAALELAKLTQRYLISCVCAALNPPCPNCTDDAVLLAGIDVLDCDVQSICQVVRRNVLSGPGLRYWLGLNRIPGLLEQVCCAEDLCLSWGDGGGEVPLPPRLMIGEPAFLATAKTAALGEPARVLIAVAQAMVGQDTRAARLLGRALNPTQLRTDLAKWATGSPQVRQVVGLVAAQAVKDAAAEQVTQIAGQADRLIQLEATLMGRLQDVEKQLAKIEQLRVDLVQLSSPSAPETGSPGEPGTPPAPAAPRAATKKAPAKKAPAKKAAPRTTRKSPQ